MRIRLETLGEKEKEDLTYQAGLFFLDLLKTEKPDSELMLFVGCKFKNDSANQNIADSSLLLPNSLRRSQLCVLESLKDHSWATGTCGTTSFALFTLSTTGVMTAKATT